MYKRQYWLRILGINLNSIGLISTVVMNKKDKPIRVNVCWELGATRKCETLNKDHAYATRKYIENNDGVVFWFQPLDD